MKTENDLFNPKRYIFLYAALAIPFFYVIYYPLAFASAFGETIIFKAFGIQLPPDLIRNIVKIISAFCTAGALWSVYKMMSPEKAANHSINADGK